MIVHRRFKHTGTFYQNFLTLVATKHRRPSAEKEDRGSHGGTHTAANRLLCGVHPIREALLAGRTFDRLLIARGAGGPRMQEIIDLARQKSVPVRFEPREALDRAANAASHQGVVAFGSAHRYAELEDVAKDATLLVVLDGVEDPHNLGAIIRTAHAAGARAVVVPDRRAAGLTETVAKAAAGALELLPVVRVGNITQTLETLKKRGFWIYGLDERGKELYSDTEYAQPTVLVLGGEGHGLHDLVKKHCDALVRIPMAGAISSLNVSVAAGIVLFEWRRRSRSGEHQPAKMRT
jgi:23S rRNA (guanosine2251-2'-O)-methyltransferase